VFSFNGKITPSSNINISRLCELLFQQNQSEKLTVPHCICSEGRKGAYFPPMEKVQSTQITINK
jgi:hypothetical protein